MRIQLEEPTIIEAIGYDSLSRQVRFVLDKPIKIELEDVLELTNGCWTLISQGIRIPMHGRWDR